jgi:predicted lipase
MRLLSVLLVLTILNSCTSIKDCTVKPTVIVDKNKEKNSAESNTDTKNTPGTIIQNIRENATPGGQVKCSF